MDIFYIGGARLAFFPIDLFVVFFWSSICMVPASGVDAIWHAWALGRVGEQSSGSCIGGVPVHALGVLQRYPLQIS